MVDHPGSSRARRALATLVAGGAAVTACLTTAVVAASPAPAGAAEPDDSAQTPLRVTISDLDPGYLPRRGSIEVTGTVTNRDDEPWSSVSVYAVDGDTAGPMRSPEELEAALDVPADAVVGERVTDEGRPDEIDALAPGETRSYRVVVPASALRVTGGGGVYWFGVHALGSSDSVPADSLADGRARTFLPYVPDRVRTSLPTSLVLPLTRPVRYAADGALTDLEQWSRTLSPGGRLHDLVALGEVDGDDLTWTVDPAVLDAVARLARGNPGRSLAPSPTRRPRRTTRRTTRTSRRGRAPRVSTGQTGPSRRRGPTATRTGRTGRTRRTAAPRPTSPSPSSRCRATTTATGSRSCPTRRATTRPTPSPWPWPAWPGSGSPALGAPCGPGR